MTKSKLLIIGVFVALVGCFFILNGPSYLTLETIKTQQAHLQLWIQTQPLLSAAICVGVYIIITALSLPIAIPLTLLAGAVFGMLWGTVLVSIASTTGATLAMLAARYVLKETIQNRYGTMLHKVNEGFAKEGAFYLFALRLVPIAPFFLVNMVMGLLPIKTRTFFIVSQLGMLPGTAVYVYAGTTLGQLKSFQDIASPSLLIACALLGLLPLATKKALTFIRRRSSKRS
jgi:uncharacterized membrane protein YdjX (TVP38/TMEM64 family)